MKKVAIPTKMEKFYGTGTMLHPDQELVEELISQIPEGKVVTIDEMCRKMSQDYQTNVTCPMRTTNFVKTITASFQSQTDDIPFWRVIRKNHFLINSPFIEFCADNLLREGFYLERNRKGEIKLLDIEKHVFMFTGQ